jgi:FKBP12-rapamycin binding domain
MNMFCTHALQLLQQFGRDLAEAHECIRRYQRLMRDAGAKVPLGNSSSSSSQRGMHSGLGGGGTRHQADAEMALNQAWDLYYTVFRKVHYCCYHCHCYE